MPEPVPYEKFTTGMTYEDVYAELFTNSDDPNDWRYKGRSGVLGYWKELKEKMYAEYRRQFAAGQTDDNPKWWW